MKTKIFTLFLVLIASVGTLFAANKVKIGDLYYGLYHGTIGNTYGPFAEVTYESADDYSNLMTANIPTSVEYQSVTYPVRKIGESAFKGCDKLTSVTIPDGVIEIRDYAFQGCKNLTSITIPNSVTSIGTSVFYECNSLTSPIYNAHIFAFMPTSYSGAYTIPYGIETINTDAFSECQKLTSVTIPNSVTYVGGFYYCTALTSIEIPNSVTKIGWYAFLNCHSLVSITIPPSVTDIGTGAFEQCFSLTDITLPMHITRIEERTFRYCESLISIEIPSNVTKIYKQAFEQCTSLTSITCYAVNPPTMMANVWKNLNCSKITLYVPAGSVDAYKTADQWKDFGAILPISAKDAETTNIKTTTTETSVDVTWPSVTGVATYELVIRDKEGNTICTLIFNSNGQLTSISFKVPSRGEAPQHTHTAGFSYTITGLEPATEYNLTISAKNENGQEIDNKIVQFTTTGSVPTSIGDLHTDSDKPVKVLMDGQVYILRGEHVYDAQGKMIK